MDKDKEVQLLIEDRRATIFCEPADVFGIIKGLSIQGKNPQFRVWDKELNDWTCWQRI